MKIKHPLFNYETKEAKLVLMSSMFSREKEYTIEFVDVPVQIQVPAEDCILVEARDEEKQIMLKAGYKLRNK